jgi:hypothetical protein
MECKECGQVTEVKVSDIINILIECNNNKSIFSGFLCDVCAKLLDAED